MVHVLKVARSEYQISDARTAHREIFWQEMLVQSFDLTMKSTIQFIGIFVFHFLHSTTRLKCDHLRRVVLCLLSALWDLRSETDRRLCEASLQSWLYESVVNVVSQWISGLP